MGADLGFRFPPRSVLSVSENLDEMLQGAGRAGGVSGAELVQEEPAQDGDEQGRRRLSM